MTGHPNLVTSRRRQHELLRSWSTWAMTSILLDPSEVAQVRESGWSGTHHTDPTTGERIAGTTDGLGFGLDESWHNPRELIAWPDIEAIAESVPTEIREQLVELREQLREHSRTYPRFAASAAAIGCGPIVEGEPLTPRQEAYIRELDAFEASGVLPAWEQKKAALDAERIQLHERALSAVLDQEPADLLELLEDQHLGQAAAEAPTDPKRETAAPDATDPTGHNQEVPMRIRNYTDQQRTALENLRLPDQFTFTCERRTAHSSEKVIFEYSEGDRHDAVILDVDDRSRGYLDAGAAVLVARAHQRYQRQARDSVYLESSRARSVRAADALAGWLATHPSLEVKAWESAQHGRTRPAATERTAGSRPIGEGRERISIAELRRSLPVGARVQVFYLAGQRDQTEPDVRTVTKQTSHKMITTPVDGDRGAHLSWSGTRAERDAAGILIVRHGDGTPIVAYKPLAGTDPTPTAATLPIDPALAVRYSEARRSTDPAVLDDIAHSEIGLNRRTVAENASTSASTLGRLAADEDVTVRRQVARNPHTPAEALDRLASDPDEAKELTETKVRWYVASNPSTNSATLSRMLGDNDLMVLAAIGRHPNASTAVLEHLATAPAPGRTWVDPDVRQAVASNPSTPPEILAGWESADRNTLIAIAKNPATPTDVLERLSRDGLTDTRARAAENPSLPPEALYRVAHEDTDAWVRQHAASNPNIEAADSHRVALDREPDVRRALARNPHVDPAVLTRLQADPDTQVRAALATNPNIAPATLQALLGDANPRVQSAVAQNTSAAERAASGQRPALLPPASRPREADELRRPSPATGVAR
ncbi:hypothetical protein K8W59_19465 [Nocardioides rotundus]|uniref:hypothetical protein n=1 Tax=Nocardioides rotundus TaxID=1774216 RepID=UPI001CC0D7E8|nr:hypothetical protein [Nocardioides rotundus]UAL29870.1 hypothetical protein K8W59_19465 [Nocardioides rotundus]